MVLFKVAASFVRSIAKKNTHLAVQKTFLSAAEQKHVVSIMIQLQYSFSDLMVKDYVGVDKLMSKDFVGVDKNGRGCIVVARLNDTLIMP